MRYNLKRKYKKILVLALAVFFLLGVLSADCLAFEEDTGVSVEKERVLILDASVSEGGGCVEVVLGSSGAACGVLATLSYDPELLSFVTFAKIDTLAEQITVSCLDSNGRLRILIDGDENFDGGVWCRFFFSINETKLNESTESMFLSEISASVDSAYEKSESGYGELCFDDLSVALDLNEYLDREQTGVEQAESVSVRWTDFGYAFEKYCAVCVSGFADNKSIAAGFEITVSCENLTESYTASCVLPVATGGRPEYTVIMPLPLRDSFYVTVRELGYSGREVISAEKTYCFFVSGSGIERVGSD